MGVLLRGLKGKNRQAFRNYLVWEIKRKLLILIHGSESLLVGLTSQNIAVSGESCNKQRVVMNPFALLVLLKVLTGCLEISSWSLKV